MTVKDLAYFTDKNKSTIGRWIEKTGHDTTIDKLHNATRDNPADFTADEVEIILNASSMSRDAVLILMANARETERNLPAVIDSTVGNVVDYEIIGKMIGMAVSAAMTPLVTEFKRMNQGQLEAPKQDYYSLAGYCSLHKIKTSDSDMRKIGMDLRKMAIKAGMDLHKVPNERYGQVNSYPVEILDDYFTV